MTFLLLSSLVVLWEIVDLFIALLCIALRDLGGNAILRLAGTLLDTQTTFGLIVLLVS